mmetsp:Transcript_18305/g.32902  ORF Transcript_18305/g.32902 Transcript_18305/m.32902 type:complete len:121 (+) Transcript_18305:7-369(+)
MGCTMCLANDLFRRPLELNYEDTKVTISARPEKYLQLIDVILRLVPAARSEEDLVVEYSGPDGIRVVMNDVTLQEAYVSSWDRKLVLGIRLSKDYVPFEYRARGTSSHSAKLSSPSYSQM